MCRTYSEQSPTRIENSSGTPDTFDVRHRQRASTCHWQSARPVCPSPPPAAAPPAPATPAANGAHASCKTQYPTRRAMAANLPTGIGCLISRAGPMGNHRYWTLQAQLPRAVLPEQTPVPDVPPHHLNAAVSSLIHNRTLRSSGDSRTSGVTGPQGCAKHISPHRAPPVQPAS